MCGIEDAGGSAHGVVLGQVGAVAHRHLPAGEIGEAGPSIDVQLVKGGRSIAHGVLLDARLRVELPLKGEWA